jgi:hypothetical protein
MKLSLWPIEAIQPAIDDFEASIIDRNNRIVNEPIEKRRAYLIRCNKRDQCMIDELKKLKDKTIKLKKISKY